MDILNIDRKLVFVRNGASFIRARNKSGGGVAQGDVVIYDTTNSNTSEIACTTSASADDALIMGMCVNSAADGDLVDVQISGPTAFLKVNGTTDISIGDFVSTHTVAKIGAKATTGKAGAFAIALEAYTTNDSSGVIDAILIGPASRMDATASVSYGTAGQMATPGLAAANAAGTTAAVARIDHEHILKANNDVDLVFGTTNAAGTAAKMQYDTAETVDALKLGLDATSRRLIIMDYADIGLDTALAAATDPELVLMDATHVDWLKIHTTLTGAEYDVPTSNTHRFLVNGTLEASISASGMVLEASNTFQHLGAAAAERSFVIDVNGNEILAIHPIASAVNQLKILNAASGSGPEMQAVGDDTNVSLLLTAKGTGSLVVNNGTDPVAVKVMGAADSYTNYITDLSGNEILGLQGVTSAVNQLNIKSSATGSRPAIEVEGGDVNIGITILTKGSGNIILDNGTDPVGLVLNGAVGGYNAKIADTNNNEIILLQGVASAVNELSITNAATTAGPTLSATGGDTNIDFNLLAKGTGAIILNNGTDPVLLKLMGAAGSATNYITDVNANELLGFSPTASAVNELVVTNAATGVGPTLSATGGDTNIPINLLGKGTGGVIIDNGTDPVTLKLMGAAATVTNYITDVNGNELLGFQPTASAVNQLAIINSATTFSPNLVAEGGDTDVGMILKTKGASWLLHKAASQAVTNGSVAFNKQLTALTNDGTNTLTAAQFRAGIITHSGQTASRADTTPTAALLVGDIIGAVVGTTYEIIYANTDDASDAVFTAGAGVTLVGSGTVAAGKAAIVWVNFTNVTAASEAVTMYIIQPA